MGRPEFENQTAISAIAGKKIRVLSRNVNLPLPSGTYERVTVFSSPRTVSKVLNVRMSMGLVYSPIAGTTTAHKEMGLENYFSPTYGIGIVKGINKDKPGSSFSLEFGCFNAFDDLNGDGVCTTVPAQSEIPAMLNNLYFDDVMGLTFFYRQAAGSTANIQRSYYCFVQEEQVSRV